MEKKQKKELVLIIVLSVLAAVFALSIIFTKPISSSLNRFLKSGDIYIENNSLTVHFVSVGQGDCIAIRFPNGKIMIIDAGPKDNQNNITEYINEQVLFAGREEIIDYLVLTHPDVDHSGGMSAIFENYEIRHFFRPNIACESESLNNFPCKSQVEEYNEVINASKVELELDVQIINREFDFKIGESRIEIFPPVKNYPTTNEMSPIIKLTFKNKSFLFTGDISQEAERDMIEEYGSKLKADVLKVAHHGSSSSSSNEFIQMVSPKYAVICVGINTYGHPNIDVLRRLQDNNVAILTTVKEGVRFISNGQILEVVNEETTISHVYIHWWAIALTAIIILVIYLMKIVIVKIKRKQKEQEEI